MNQFYSFSVVLSLDSGFMRVTSALSDDNMPIVQVLLELL